jgi:predicted  nucleic acid-binding Zn-ribbon protein|tara:strand:- start:241 stop:726 length:486 start_codon:yes stop_codon:yes gene_type:complete
MMVVDARDRQQLRERLEATLGERPAEVLMEHLFDEGASDVGTQLAGLDLRLVEMGERMDAMGERMDAMGERMDAMLVLFEQRFDAIDRRFVSLETRMGGLETRIGGLEIRMESVEERLGRMEPGLEKLDDRTHTVLRTVMTSFLVTTFSSWGLVLAAMALT